MYKLSKEEIQEKRELELAFMKARAKAERGNLFNKSVGYIFVLLVSVGIGLLILI